MQYEVGGKKEQLYSCIYRNTIEVINGSNAKLGRGEFIIHGLRFN